MTKISHVGWFIAFVFIVSIVTFVMLNRANESLIRSHQTIINQYKGSIHLTHALMKTCEELRNDTSKNSASYQVLAKRVEKATELLASRENDEKTLNLLELEFSKIQNEYVDLADFFFPSATAVLSPYLYKTQTFEAPLKFALVRNAIRELIY